MEVVRTSRFDRKRQLISTLLAVTAALWVASASAQVGVTIQENTLGFCGVEGTVDSNQSGFTGSGFANADNATGRGVDWIVNVAASGVYQLEWRFANGSTARPGSVKINGATVTTVGFPSTGLWTSWTTVTTTVNLNAGRNSIRLEATTSGGLANIDSLAVTGGSGVQAAECGGGSPEILIEENTTGFCGVDGTIDSNNAGFTGRGFANGNNALGAGITYSIESDHAASVMLRFRFAAVSNRPANIEVNGSVAGTANFASTVSWTNWTSESITVALPAGKNTVRLLPRTADGLPNVDSLTVVGNGLKAGACNVTDACGDITASNNLLSSCNGNPAVCLLGGGVGNYRVTMKFDGAFNGELEVFAESRRRMFTSPQQDNSTARCVNLLVNVRDPEGEPLLADHGTAGLNLRVTKGATALTGLTAISVTSPRTLFIAGDSTVADQPPQLQASPTLRFTGWGQFIPAHFGNGIAISNYADSGESTAAFRTDGGALWNLINARLKSGDWVMIQLGHNDKTTPAALYRSRITNMVTAIRSKGANPILITPMIRNTGDPLSAQHIWGDLNIRNELIGVANAQGVPLVDLMKLSSEWAAGIGQSAAQAYFVGNDRTHSNELGATLFAQMIVNEIRRQNVGIDVYLR
jgi:lysophospholipase L1-like esterase